MGCDYSYLIKSLRTGQGTRGGYAITNTQPPTKIELEAADTIERLVRVLAVTDENWKKVVAELDLYRKLCSLERLEELMKAEREGRICIIPPSTGRVCGTCEHFNREPGCKWGTCKVKRNVVDRYNRPTEFPFRPYQSRTACKSDYIKREGY